MHLERFYTYLQFERRYSPHTISAYRSDITQFTDYITETYGIPDEDLIKVNHRQIRSWIMLLMEQGKSARSVNRKLSALKTYYRYCRKQQLITRDPMAKITSPKTPSVLPVFVEPSGIDRLFDLIANEYPETNDKERFVRTRDTLILELLYGTGIRRAELLGLEDTAFDRANGNVKVTGKGNKERIIPVSKEMLRLVDTYIAERNRLFGPGKGLLVTASGGRAYPKMIYTIVHRLLRQVSTLARTSPHVLRHTFATHLSNNGADLNAIKELLGHASLASTQVYTHNSIEQLKKIHKRAHPKG